MSDPKDELRDLVTGFRTHLIARGRTGLLGIPHTPSESHLGPVGMPLSTGGVSIAALATQENEVTLTAVREELGDCQRCQLSTTRRQIVFGTGNPKAALMFVGEAPGADEDMQGEPFVGLAGQLLTKMIRAMGYTRTDVYICNIIKCRPPHNRNPEEAEIDACVPFLQKQIAAVAPRVIVALGKFAAQFLCQEETPISRLRGHWKTYCNVPVMPTYHPAYLLRDESKKGEAWSDLKQVMARLTELGLR
jgi:DNA polymerase